MADLQGGPPNVEDSWENNVEGILGGSVLALEPSEEGNEAADHQDKAAYIPWLSLPDLRLGLVRKNADDGGGDAVADLSSEEGTGCGVGLHNFFEEVEEVVEPACGGKIVDEVPHPVGPNVQFRHPVVLVLLLKQGTRIGLLLTQNALLVDRFH